MRDSRSVSIVRHVVLVVCAILFAAPLYIAVVAASHSARSLLGQFPALPGDHLVGNLIHVLTVGFPNTSPVGLMLVNSAIMALGITLGKLVVSIPAAYAVVYFRFPGRMLMFWVIFATLLLPVEVRFFPTYQVTAQLNLLNGFPGLILPIIASATATFLFRQFFMTLPKELIDAARIDGISPLGFLWRIVLPLSLPNLAAIMVIEFVYGWNQYLWPLLATTSERYQTVVMGIQGMIQAATSFSVPEWNLVMATAIIALLPPVIVVILMQRWFIKGLTGGIN
ncbi:MAG: sn-glycerol-3-phosphate ABC transporter permease UgpE [Sulfobacillus acidophilus]|uniref:sn-glycerol-3-phosphate ABC transporter permease UgpE n=1 Tax=Sulfobacillus acidophilus TaxID=53633 RepID=A0A2T2WJG4_9FIRM|nr:MAG: sn-glycerol-3-phosphate ABC transporter permease UgpE [Sulfobacillus acidophilus]